MKNRYSTKGLAEVEYEPGSRGRVLRNLLGIRSARAMAHAESEALLSAQERLVETTTLDQRFISDDNGRGARLLTLLMGLQAGLPPLDFGGLSGRGKRNYIAAIHAAVGSDYAPMTAVFSGVVRRSLRRLGR